MRKIILLISLLFLSNTILFAQQKKYVSYIVKQGETMKSIAKYYNLSTRDLLRLNPGIKRRPKVNTVIIVPNENYGNNAAKVNDVLNNGNFYTVKPKETLYGISKKFNITIEELKKANPKLVDGVKIGMQLIIPEPTNNVAIDSTTYVMHKVIKDDTFYSLTKKYEVTEEDLKLLNPELIHGLKLGMNLKIKSISLDENENEDDGLKLFTENIDVTKKLKVYFMLPYQMNKLTDSIEIKGFKKANSLLNIVTDFHLGAMMAIDSLREKGVQINVEFMDSEKSKFKLQLLVNEHHFTKNDVIIGPMFYDNAYWLSNHVNSYVVAPFYSKRQELLSAKNLVKSTPDNLVSENKLMTYMEKNYHGENVIVINDEKAQNQSKLWRIVNKLKAIDSIKNIEVIKPKKNYIDGEVFKQKLDTLGKNWVFLISDDIVTTSAAVNNLKTYATDVDVTLFALHKGRNFDNINNLFLGELNLVYPSTGFMNINDPKTKRFYAKFKSKNFALPSKYAIKGFDLTYDILIKMASSENISEGLLSGESSRIRDNFNFVLNDKDEIENEDVQIMRLSKDLIPIIVN